MAAFTRRLFTAVGRAGGISAGAAESITAAAGWTLSNITAAASAVPGPFGFGLGTVLTSTAAGSHTASISANFFAAGWNLVSIFVRPGTLTAFRVSCRDATNVVDHRCDFTLSGGTWAPGVIGGGAQTVVSADVFGNGWIRLTVGFVIGAPGTAPTVANNARQILFRMLGDSQTVELWGAYVQGSNVDFVFPTAPPPYMIGMADSAQALPVVHPQRVKDSAGIAQVGSNNPSTTVIQLQGRADYNAPWTTVETFNFALLDANLTLAKLVSIWPQMRPYFTSLDPDPSTTSDFWLTE